MNCTKCGTPLNDDAQFCVNCGATVEPQAAGAPASQPVQAQPVYANPAPANTTVTEKNLPPEYRPLSPWAYFGLQLLYSVPIVGLIFLIIFSFKRDNINRRNFTRSYWCVYIVLLVLVVTIFAIYAGVVGSFIALY